MSTLEIISALRLAVDLAKALGITKQDLADALAKAHAEGREFGEADLQAFRDRADAATSQLDLSIRNAEDALSGRGTL